MAVELYDDYEQGERVKQWIKENGGGILLGIALAVGGLFGYRYWQGQQQQQNFTAALQYQIVSDLLAESASAEQTETGEDSEAQGDDAVMLSALADLQNNYSDNLYAALATLQVADLKLGEDDLQGASQQYQFIIDNSDNTEIRSIAMLRLARAQLAMQQPDAALQTLNGLSEGAGHAGLAARIKGEVYLAMDDRQQALAAFEEAEAELGGTPDRMLELRLADLRDIDIDTLLEGAEVAPVPPAFSGNTTPVNAPSEPVSITVEPPAISETQDAEQADSDAEGDSA